MGVKRTWLEFHSLLARTSRYIVRRITRRSTQPCAAPVGRQFCRSLVKAPLRDCELLAKTSILFASSVRTALLCWTPGFLVQSATLLARFLFVESAIVEDSVEDRPLLTSLDFHSHSPRIPPSSDAANS